MKNDKKWYTKKSNWAMIIACIILIPMLLVNIYIIYQAKTNKEEVPSILGYKPFIVLSGSMETKIHKGDLIFVKEIDPSELTTEDVIAFRDAEETVTTHRIIDIVDKDGVTYFITKGDNNSSQDQNLVEYEDVEGIYVGRVPNIGNIMNSLAEPTTVIIIIFGITVAFGIAYTISNKKLKDIEREEFLEYKRLKEMEALKQEEVKETSTKKEKTSSKKTSNKKEDNKKTTKEKEVVKKETKKKESVSKETSKKTTTKKTDSKEKTKPSK